MTDMDKAERLTRRRARMMPILAIVFIAQQGIYFSQHEGAARAVDQFKISAWLVLSVVLLLAVWTGGAWFRSRAVRELMNDEVTRAHRAVSFRLAFLASMTGCILVYVMTMFTRVEGRDAVHIVLTIGISVALLSFGVLERRALKDV